MPFAVGDSYKGLPIVGTLPKFFGVDDQGKPLPADEVMAYRPDETYQFAEGRPFRDSTFEAVIGSEGRQAHRPETRRHLPRHPRLPRPQGEARHPQARVEDRRRPEAHDPPRTTRRCSIPLQSFYTLTEHDEGLVAQQAIREGKNPLQAVAAFNAAAELRKQQNGAEGGGRGRGGRVGHVQGRQGGRDPSRFAAVGVGAVGRRGEDPHADPGAGADVPDQQRARCRRRQPGDRDAGTFSRPSSATSRRCCCWCRSS